MTKWPVPGGLSKALYIAHRESGPSLAWYAKNPTSGACGIYQHLPRYWPSRQNDHDNRPLPLAEPCTDARANVIVAIQMVHHNGWGPWGG